VSGLEHLRALFEGFLQHLEKGVFPGGCFFASVAAETDTHPGPVRERALEVVTRWSAALEAAAADAQREGSLDASEDAAQLAFELNAYLLHANAQFVAGQEATPLERARRAMETRLAAAGAPAAPPAPSAAG
jgi:hypothetical protein